MEKKEIRDVAEQGDSDDAEFPFC